MKFHLIGYTKQRSESGQHPLTWWRYQTGQNLLLQINFRDKMYKCVGTPLYMAVQILKSIDYSSKCDIWALGVIFYEMLHGKTPWTARRGFQLVNNIENRHLKIERKDLCANTVDFLTKCLQIYEKERMSWNEVFVQPIFQSRFLSFADESKEFQNKMKSIMTKIRIHFQQNEALFDKHLWKYGLNDSNQELSFAQYFEFLKAAIPTITVEEASYIFKKIDIDDNDSISLDRSQSCLKSMDQHLIVYPWGFSSWPQPGLYFC